ncbi:hypothetical protein [Sphingomonas sp.]|uniref:hypothetical protein n=1 Tax=Sphingomonas sp. TaxID=28214 RepID=UPI0025D623AB|nr:hypothetical protein [Sphingomonas sp.]MBV9528286.1 hypothetical protein [Sphingomonas sp.]
MKLNVTARDTGLVIAALAIGAAAGLWTHLPTTPDEDNLLGLIGSLIGAAIALIAGLIVIWRQFETTDQRHLRTVSTLLRAFRKTGISLQEPSALRNPPFYIGQAYSLFKTIRSVSSELRTTGARFAVVAQTFEDETLARMFDEFLKPGRDLTSLDLNKLGGIVLGIATSSINVLENGV